MISKIAKRLTAFLCAAALAGSCLPGVRSDFSLRADAAGSIKVISGGTVSNNSTNVKIKTNTYNTGRVINSYMYESSSGVLTRVEYVSPYLVVENYNMSTGALISKKNLSLTNTDITEPLFGGFFAGKKYNFVVTGQKNLSESTSKPVICVTRYDKNFNSYKYVYFKGCNTYLPFEAGSCSMSELNGMLYIHTCHEMFKDKNGIHHQSNMDFILDEEEFSYDTSKMYYVSADPNSVSFSYVGPFGYQSHSFDQLTVADSSSVYGFDLGDAYPRTLRLHKYSPPSKNISSTTLLTVPGNIGDNYTTVQAGDMEVTSSNVIVALKMGNILNGSLPNDSIRNIYLFSVPKTSIGSSTSVKTVKLTSYGKGVECSAPKLVKINDNKILVIWRENKVTKIAIVSADGTLQGGIKQSDEIMLSECDPVLCSDGMVRWYYTNNSAPVIVALDPNNPTDFSGGGSSQKLGDVDNDNDVDIDDLTLLQKSVAGWRVSINKKNADVYPDGDIDIYDLAVLQQYIAGWKVKLGVLP
ncbi:MAG: hypothetical protein K6B74_09260 [Ruminococcus sp.]|nr:hypothetical protein [Ruminococcus sp.]